MIGDARGLGCSVENSHPKFTNLADWAVATLSPWTDVLVSGKCLTGEEVHQFRVMTKKMRAAWLMAESVDGVTGGNTAREDLKQLAKKFGGLRDGDVLSDLVHRFCKVHSSITDEGFEQWMEARVHDHYQTKAHAGHVDDWCETALARSIEAWSSQRDSLHLRPEFMRGIGRTEEKFRRRAKKALKSDSENDWHRCRRWAKYLYFEYLTLAEMADEDVSKPIKRLRGFASELGKRNDLANLKTLIHAERKGSKFSDTLKEMRAWVNKRDANYEKSTKEYIVHRLSL